MSAAAQGLNGSCNARDVQAARNAILYDWIQKPAHACWGCDKALSPETVKKCSKCRVAIYCDSDCQLRDWKIHKQLEGCPAFFKKFTDLSKLSGFSLEVYAMGQSILKSKREAEKLVRVLQETDLDRSKEISEITDAIENKEKQLQEIEALKRAPLGLPLPPALQNLDIDLERADIEELRRLLEEVKAQHELRLEETKKIQQECEALRKL